MSGVAYSVDMDLSVADGALGRLSQGQLHDIMLAIGALAEEQTKRRIADIKRGPDGEVWPDWSTDYGRTREAHHSLLVGEGHLLGSIASYVTGLEAQVGTNLVYGAVHQFGSADGAIPGRPYLGVSDADADEIRELLLVGLEEALS